MAVAKEQIRQIISENNISSVADVYTLLKDSFKDILQELMEAELDAFSRIFVLPFFIFIVKWIKSSASLRSSTPNNCSTGNLLDSVKFCEIIIPLVPIRKLLTDS